MKCPECGCEFEPHHGLQKYCSRKCKDKYNYREWAKTHRKRIAYLCKKYRWRKEGKAIEEANRKKKNGS